MALTAAAQGRLPARDSKLRGVSRGDDTRAYLLNSAAASGGGAAATTTKTSMAKTVEVDEKSTIGTEATKSRSSWNRAIVDGSIGV